MDGAEGADDFAELASLCGTFDGHLVETLGRGEGPDGQLETEQDHGLIGGVRVDLHRGPLLARRQRGPGQDRGARLLLRLSDGAQDRGAPCRGDGE